VLYRCRLSGKLNAMPRWLTLVAAASAVVLVAVAAAAIALTRNGQDCETPFDRRAWLTARASPDLTAEGPHLRRLARRLVRCDEMLGRTERELRMQLGRPTRTSVDGNPRDHREAAWKLGTNDSVSDSEDVLFVEFDQGRTVYASTPEDVEHGGNHSLSESGEPVGGGPVVVE
jgi:hypothetical protein